MTFHYHVLTRIHCRSSTLSAKFAPQAAENGLTIALQLRGTPICRNIRTLFNFEPPATDEEIRAATLQFVKKVSGLNKPSKANEAAFLKAVDEVTEACRNLMNSLATDAQPRNPAEEAAKSGARSDQRFSR